MSRTLWKDTGRAVTGSWPRFMSIAALMFLGAFALVGLKVTGPNMRATAALFYDQTGLADTTVISTWGLDETDRKVIGTASGVRDVEYGYVTDVTIDDTTTSLRVMSVPERLSRFNVESGGLPADSSQIALDAGLADSYRIGDQVTFTEPASSVAGSDDEDTGLLTRHTFTVSGFVTSAEYIDRGQLGPTTVGTGQLDGIAAVAPAAFDSDVYTIARLGFEHDGLGPYHAAYLARLDAWRTDVENLLADQPGQRLDTLRADKQTEIDDGRDEIANAKGDLKDARTKLADSATKLKDARAELQERRSEYDSQIASAEKRIASSASQLAAGTRKAAAKERELKEAAAKLTDARAQLADKKAELEEAKSSIDEAAARLAAARKDLDAKQADLDEQRKRLEQAQRQLDEQTTKLEQARAGYLQKLEALADQIAAAEQAGEDTTALEERLDLTRAAYEGFLTDTYKPGKAGIAEQQAQLDDGVAKVDSLQQRLDAGYAQLRQQQEELDQARATYASGEAAYQTAASRLAGKQKEYEKGTTALAKAKRQLAAGQKELSAARATLERQRRSGADKLDAAARKIADRQRAYDDAAADFATQEAEAKTEIADKSRELDEAQADLDALGAPKYTVTSRRDSPGYERYGDNSDRIDVLAEVFPVFLFAIAALVSLTTMTRMVDEERITNGTLAALGYGPAAIRRKYLVYGISASLLGAAVGAVLGHTLLPTVIFRAYAATVIFPGLTLAFHPLVSAVATTVAVLCTVVVAGIVATRELRAAPATLLLPKPPAAGSRILLERVGWLWRRLTFTQKVTARNLFRYKRRMYMTIFGIAGCTALLICGFGLRDSLSGIVSTQFSDILHYDLIAVEADDATTAERQEVANAVATLPGLTGSTRVHHEELTVVAGPNNAKQDITLMVASDPDTLDRFVTLRNRGDRSPLEPGKDGVVVSQKLADLLGTGVGETIALDDADGNPHDFTIGALAEFYVGHYVFLDQSSYQQVFGSEPRPNATLIALRDPGADARAAASSNLMELDGTRGIVQVAAVTSTIESIMHGLDNVIRVLIVCAILLALVVIFNLTNINVSERIRELSTIKVLGFYPVEVTMYIYRETFLLTLLGILAGYAAGIPLHSFIIEALPPDNVMFTPELLWTNFASAAAITTAISLAIMVVMHVRLKNLDMLEALKSVE